MDIVKILLLKMKRGHAGVICDLVVIRVGDKYIVGESPSVREKGIDIDAAAEKIYLYHR